MYTQSIVNIVHNGNVTIVRHGNCLSYYNIAGSLLSIYCWISDSVTLFWALSKFKTLLTANVLENIDVLLCHW